MSIELLPDVAVGFATEPLPTRDGYRYSLTTLLGKLLADAETLFGQRDKNFTPLGIEFHGDRPMIWYPGNRNHVSIMLTESARSDYKQAIFQLAHEVVHLLSPSGGANAPVVEEGLAAIFQQRANENYNLGYSIKHPAYLKAAKAANKLLQRDPRIVRQLREKEPAFYKWNPALLVSEAGLHQKIADTLCKSFLDFETE